MISLNSIKDGIHKLGEKLSRRETSFPHGPILWNEEENLSATSQSITSQGSRIEKVDSPKQEPVTTQKLPKLPPPVLCDLKEVNIDFSSFQVQTCSNLEFPNQDDPIHGLYRSASLQQSEFLEGHDALKGVIGLTRYFVSQGLKRVSEDEMVERLEAMLTLANSRLHYEDIQAVVINGSFLQGHDHPGDVDVTILTKYYPSQSITELGGTHQSMNPLEEKVNTSISLLSTHIGGVPIETRVSSCTEDLGQQGGNNMLLDGPCIAFIKNDSGVPSVFLSYAGVGYLKYKDDKIKARS